jgi:hypothetical protein
MAMATDTGVAGFTVIVKDIGAATPQNAAGAGFI